MSSPAPPPGYVDYLAKKDKDGDHRWGDLKIWFQIREAAGRDKRHLILVTNERKRGVVGQFEIRPASSPVSLPFFAVMAMKNSN